MKFIDPLACLQYMGGPLPIHVTLLMLNLNTAKEIIQCDSPYKKYDRDDFDWMIVAHIIYIIEIIFRRMITPLTGMKFNYLKHCLSILNKFIYLSVILFMHFSFNM